MENEKNTEDVSHLFKPGYKFEVPIIDFNSAEVKAEIAQAHFEQAEIMERKKIDTESLYRRMDI